MCMETSNMPVPAIFIVTSSHTFAFPFSKSGYHAAALVAHSHLTVLASILLHFPALAKCMHLKKKTSLFPYCIVFQQTKYKSFMLHSGCINLLFVNQFISNAVAKTQVNTESNTCKLTCSDRNQPSLQHTG